MSETKKAFSHPGNLFIMSRDTKVSILYLRRYD